MKKKLPTPQKLPSGMYRCQVMVNGKRVSVVEEAPRVAQAKAVAMKSSLIEKKKPSSMTVGDAIARYIDSKDAVLSPSTIRGYRSLQKGILVEISGVRLSDLTQESIQRFINKMAKGPFPQDGQERPWPA